MIKGIVFDKDGTLLDFDALWIPVANATLFDILLHYGLQDRADELKEKLLLSIGVENGETDITGVLAGGTFGMMAECFGRVLTEYGVNAEKDELCDVTTETFIANFSRGEIQPACGGLRDFLIWLRKQGITVALITSDDLFGTEKCLSVLGIGDCFDEIYCNDRVHPPKPDPYYMDCFRKKYGFSADEVCMVGDTYTDCDFAVNCGVMMIGVAANEKNRQSLLKRTPTVYSDITHIPLSMLTDDPQHTGELYLPTDPDRAKHQMMRLEMLYDYNMTRPSEQEKRDAMLKTMFATIGDGCYIEPPLHANMAGEFVRMGSNVYANFGLTLVDDTEICIGDCTMLGPNVVIATASHPLDNELRSKAYQQNKPVRIGKNCWLGAGVTVLPGVTIGDNCVIGAGSVVTKDIPAGSVAVGVPCRVKKE